MGEEFQGGVCGGNWWNNSPRNLFASSPCSSGINDICSFGVMWPNNNNFLNDMKSTRSSSNSAGSNSDNNNSVVLQEVSNPQHTIQRNMPYHDWNHEFINDSAKSEENYSQFLQETTSLNSSMNFVEDSSINSLNQSSQGLTNGFPLNSSSYGYTSSLLQTLFDTDSEPQSLNNQSMNYSPAQNCAMINPNEFLPSFPKASPMIKPKKQLNNLQFTNNTPFWNATASSNVPSTFPLPTQSQFLPSSNGKVNRANFTPKHHNQEPVAKKANSEPAFKRPRIETPSPLPTFKVRKEKMGDRVTALQQLVSPFGKTDTASVLHEAIEYIKFLHDQVGVLSAPYLKNGSPSMQHQQTNDQEGVTQDLRSRGLCLVPISSTYPVTTETPNDFWTPAFGGSFR